MLLLDALVSVGALLLRLYDTACIVLELHFTLVTTLLQLLRGLIALPGAALDLVSNGAFELTASCFRLARGGFALLGGLGLEWLGATRAALSDAPGAAAEAVLAAARLPGSAALGLAGGIRAAAEALGGAGATLLSGLGAAVRSAVNAVGGAVAATGAAVTNSADAAADGVAKTVGAGVGAVTGAASATLGAATHSAGAVAAAFGGAFSATLGAVAGTAGAFTSLLGSAALFLTSSADAVAEAAASAASSAAGVAGSAYAAATALLAVAVDVSLFALAWPFRLLSFSVGALAATLTLQGLFATAALICLSSWYLSPQLRRQVAVAVADARVPRLLSAASRFVSASLVALMRSRQTARDGPHRQRLEGHRAPAPPVAFQPPAARRNLQGGDRGPPRVDAPRPERRPVEPRPDEQRGEEEEAADWVRERERAEATRNGSGDAAGVRQEWEQQEVAREEENVKNCVVCQDQRKGTVLLPCRHLCLCGDCARTIMRLPFHQQKCPLCRSNIVHTMDVFL